MSTYYVTTGGSNGDGSQGSPWNSLANAVAGLGASYDCVTNTNQVTLVCAGSSADSAAADFSGWTTSATYFLQIEAASGHEAQADAWKTDRYRLDVGGATPALEMPQYGRLVDLQVGTTPSTGGAVLLAPPASGACEQRYVNCRFEADWTAGAGTMIDLASSTESVYVLNNCILAERTNKVGTALVIAGAYYAYLRQCTVANCWRGLSTDWDSALCVNNTLITNCTTPTLGGARSTTVVSDYNFTDGSAFTSGYGANSVAYDNGSAFTFEAGTRNYQIASGDTGAKDECPDLVTASDAYWFVGRTDIDGNTRPTGNTWDAGAHEYVAGGSPGSPAPGSPAVTRGLWRSTILGLGHGGF